MKTGIDSALSAIGRIQSRIGEIEARIGVRTGGAGFERAIARAGGLVASSVKAPPGPAPGGVAPSAGAAPGGMPIGGASPGRSRPALLGPGAGEEPQPPSQLGGGTASFRSLIADAASRHGVDPALVRAVMAAESGGDPRATSPVGAMGLMQLMPGTAKALGVADAYDPAQNVEGGAKYLAELTRRFGLQHGVAAYNAGPGAVEKHGGVPPYRETRAYVDRVMRFYDEFSKE